MTSDTGTRQLADGMPSYRLVRREDVELAAGAARPRERPRVVPPRRRLARLDAHGAHARLARRRARRHACPLVRDGLLRARGRARALPRRPRRRSSSPAPAASSRSASRTRSAADGRARWIEMAAPRPAPGRERHVLPRPGAGRRAPEPLDVRDPRNRNLFLLGDGQMDLDVLKHGAAVGAPTVSSSMATAVLAYSGIAVKMLVDQRLDAQLHTMFMVDYQPGAVAHPHDHPFEESYYMLEGEVDVVADGDRYTLRPGRLLLDRGRLRARVLRGAGRTRALARDVRARAAGAPLVPLRARLGLPRRAARLGQPRLPNEQRERARARRPRAVHADLPPDAPDPRLRGSRAGALPEERGVRDDAPVLGAGGCRDRRREPARGPRPRRRDLSRARSCARARRRPAGAPRRDARPRDRHQRRPRRLDERDLAGRPPDRLVRDRRRQHRRRDGRRARALAHDGRRRGRVLRRRRDEPGLRLRVPQLRAGAEAAARARVREQRLRRVHGLPRRHRRRDPRPRRDDGGARRDDRRDERVDRARSCGARARACPLR